jgi:probable addiction module antidote protein
MAQKTTKRAVAKKALTLTPYDSADYLKTEAAQAAYLEAALEDSPNDPAALAEALNTIARARGMAKLARDTGMTRAGLYRALSKDGNPSYGTVAKVMKALGLRLTAQPL